MADVNALLVKTIREERGRLVGGLLRLCGNIDACEDALQEAVLAAATAWRSEVPMNPGAWLMTAATNCAKDTRRRHAIAETRAPLLADADDVEQPDSVDTVSDDILRLMFTCCHPEMATDNQIALTLKVVAGFSTTEIARAFVCSEATVSQRILRAKQTLEEKQVPYDVPQHGEFSGRVRAVLGVIYAMFNEGHTGAEGPLMRLDLQAEAISLAVRHVTERT